MKREEKNKSHSFIFNLKTYHINIYFVFTTVLVDIFSATAIGTDLYKRGRGVHVRLRECDLYGGERKNYNSNSPVSFAVTVTY